MSETTEETPLERVRRLQETRDVMTGVILAGFNARHPDSKDIHWTEDFPHENGMYQNQCCVCFRMFLGHKRRPACKACTEKR